VRTVALRPSPRVPKKIPTVTMSTKTFPISAPWHPSMARAVAENSRAEDAFFMLRGSPDF
jgi:hypothetical protein